MDYALAECQRLDIHFTAVMEPLLEQRVLDAQQQLPPSNQDVKSRQLINAKVGLVMYVDSPELPACCPLSVYFPAPTVSLSPPPYRMQKLRSLAAGTAPSPPPVARSTSVSPGMRQSTETVGVDVSMPLTALSQLVTTVVLRCLP